MAQRQAKYIITAAFPEPNYTQTPNSFFDMLPDMDGSEVAVTLIMIRNTFGYHRNSFKMGIAELMDATGLSRNSVRAGAEAAERRGTFRRTNPGEQTKAEWELIVDGQPLRVNYCPQEGQPLTLESSTIDPQVRVKERKETIKETDDDKTAELKKRTALLSKLYSANIGAIVPLVADALQDAAIEFPDASWYEPAFLATASARAGWNYTYRVLRNWKEKGRDWMPETRKAQTPQKSQVTKTRTVVEEWLADRGITNGN